MSETLLREKSKAYYEEALKTLTDFIKINSIHDESTIDLKNEKPFGEGVYKALRFIGSTAEQMGFKVDYCDGYCDEISFGEGENLDIYAHADVVPVSKNWKHDPFGAEIENEQMFGRGTSDDKGPAVAALYALKMLKDMDLLKGFRVRLIIGGNEERGSECLNHYFNVLHRGYPTYGFTPDGDFPLIYGEKGIFTYDVTYDLGDLGIDSFAFGEATNVVLADAQIRLPNEENLEEKVNDYQARHKEVKVTLEGDLVKFRGKASHGSLPWEGVNAGLHMLNFIGELRNNDTLKEIYLDYFKGNGENYGGDYTSKYFSDSSYCVGVMSYDKKTLKMTVNMRLPENVTAEKALANLIEKRPQAHFELCGGSEALIMSPESSLVKLLMNAYQEETGDYESQPEAIGGGTYARESKNSVAFGSKFVGKDNRIHDDEEFIDLSDLYESISIYAHGILNLGKDIASKKESK